MQLLKMRKFCCWFWYVILLMISLCEGRLELPANVSFAGVFAFGDSIVDQGNNNVLMGSVAKCNFPPYGKDFNGGTPTGRFSNGRTPPDITATHRKRKPINFAIAAEDLGIKDLVPAYLDPTLNPQDLLTGVSFASGGCGYDPLTSQIMTAISLSDQLGQFKECIMKLKGLVGEESANKILNNSLYVVVVGSNDLANNYFSTHIRRLHYNISSYADLLVSKASTFTQELYNLGARKISVMGIPALGCTPFQRSLAGGVCAEELNEAAQLVNSKLSPALDILTRALPQSTVLYLDFYNPLLHLIQNPQIYGFEVSDKGCCGTGNVEVGILCNRFSRTCTNDSKYVFWDSYHPTERAYKILVDQTLQKYISRYL